MFGSRVAAVDPGVTAFNARPPERARADLTACCAASRWVAAVESGRPYADRTAVAAAAMRASAALRPVDVRAALEGHPRIGERAGGGADGSRWSRDEQSGVRRADATLAALTSGNRAYEQRFGHIYLVCATGLTSDQMLADLERRLDNDDETEQRVVAGELARIAQLRIGKLLDELAAG